MANELTLEELYTTIDNLRRGGFNIPDDLLSQINEKEEQLIKTEVLPVIHETIEPTLAPVQRPLVLVVEYDPNGTLKVNLSRKVNVASVISDAKEIQLDPEVIHNNRKSPSEPVTHGPKTTFTVKFKDGTLIAEKNATDTFTKVIQKIGADRVRELVEPLKLRFCKVPLISNRRDPKYGKTQRDLGNGWLLITHSNNEMKKIVLDKISKALNLGLEVTVIK